MGRLAAGLREVLDLEAGLAAATAGGVGAASAASCAAEVQPVSTDPVPTQEQAWALSVALCESRLTDRQVGTLAALLDEVGRSVRVAAQLAERYPAPYLHAATAGVWEAVASSYWRLVQAVSPVAEPAGGCPGEPGASR